MLKQLALAIFAATALLAVQSHANAGNKCGPEACLTNGTQLTGIAEQTSEDSERFEGRGGCPEEDCGLNGTSYQGVLLSGVTLQNASGKHGVNTIILPSGEIVNLR